MGVVNRLFGRTSDVASAEVDSPSGSGDGDVARVLFVATLVFSAALMAVGLAPESDPGSASRQLAPARLVVVPGDFSREERAIVDWALARFEEADMELPASLSIRFDPTRVECHGLLGWCCNSAVPPQAIVCIEGVDTPPASLERKIILLHELAHVWHWARSDGVAWPDYSSIVGGLTGDPDPMLNTEERVAAVISWGLLDQRRRPVRSELSCAEMFVAFEMLTGHAPLDPIEPYCRPD